MAEDVKVILGVDPSTESNVQGWFSGKEFKVRLTPEGEFAKQLEASLQAAQENASKKAADSVAKNLTSAQEKAAKSWETQQRSQITAWAKEQIKAEEDVQRAKEKADKAWAAQQTKQVQELAKAQEKAAKELAKAQEKTAKDSVKNQIQGLNTKTMSNNIQTWLNQNTNAANEFKQRMLSIKSELDSGLVDGDRAKVLSAEIKEIESAARAAAPSITSLGNALKTALGGTALGALAKAGVAFVGRELRTAAREMVQSAVEIESALAQLQVVTGASGSQLDQFFEASAASAKKFGVEVKDMLGSVETFSRLGLNLQDSLNLSEMATTLSNVAAMSVDDATQGLTSVIFGYGMTPADGEHVADVVTKIGQSFAISGSEIMDGMTRVSAAASASNTSFEKTVALLAGGNAAMQDAAKTSTALRTIMARVRGKLYGPPRMATYELMLCA